MKKWWRAGPRSPMTRVQFPANHKCFLLQLIATPGLNIELFLSCYLDLFISRLTLKNVFLPSSPLELLCKQWKVNTIGLSLFNMLLSLVANKLSGRNLCGVFLEEVENLEIISFQTIR